MASEAAKEYKSSLEELTFNSKLHINVLTMLAEENARYAENIVAVIENHIIKAPPDRKLPTLYLMDSIMKNLRSSTYSKIFAQNIVSTFVAVFEKVDEKKRQSMYKLRQTWNEIFPKSKLYAVDVRINRIDPAWPITAAGTETVSSIHVNPKFLAQTKEDVGPSSENRASVVDTESEDWSQQQNMKQEEEEKLRKELVEEEKRIYLEEQMKLKEKEEQKRKWEEEQERKMRDELLAKQQELMRLQQQRLEMELEETRRALLEKEKELKRKEQEESRKSKMEDEERKRREELSKIKAEEEMRKQMEAEIRRKTEEHLKRKQEADKKKALQEQAKKTEVDSGNKRDPRLRGQAKAGKAQSLGSPTSKKSLPNSPDMKTRKNIQVRPSATKGSISPVKRTPESKATTSSPAKVKGASAGEEMETDAKTADGPQAMVEEDQTNQEHDKKESNVPNIKSDTDQKDTEGKSSRDTSKVRKDAPRKEDCDKFGRQMRSTRGRNGESKSSTRVNSGRNASKTSTSGRDRDFENRKRSVTKESNSPARESSSRSKIRDSDRERARRPRNYRPHRLSKSPSSEEELFSVRPRQESPIRQQHTRIDRELRSTRSSRSSQSPDYHVKRSRQDNDRKEARPPKKTSESLDVGVKDKEDSAPKLYKKRHSSDVFPEEKNLDTPPLKKIRDDKSTESNKTEKISDDLADLFGSEDIDYRKLNKPSFPKKPLLERPDFSSPQQKGWAKFKENRPEEFPFQQPRRISVESEFRSPRPCLLSPPVSTPVGDLISPKLISLEGISAILRQADIQLHEGKMSQLQHRELMAQLQELHRLQSLMSNLRNNKKHKGWDSSGSMNLSAGEDLTSPSFESRRKSFLESMPSPVPSLDQQGHVENSRKMPLLETPRNRSPNQEVHESNLTSSPEFYDLQKGDNERPRKKLPLLEPPPIPALLDSPRKTLLSLPPDPSININKQELRFTERKLPPEPSIDINKQELEFTERKILPGPSINKNKQELKFTDRKSVRDLSKDAAFDRDLSKGDAFDRRNESREEKGFYRNRSEGRFVADRFQKIHDTPRARHRRHSVDNIQKVPYNEEKYYVPEFDQRWAVRQRFYKNERESLNRCELVVDGRTYDLKIGSEKSVRLPKSHPKKVRIDQDTHEVSINGVVYARMGDSKRSVVIGGQSHVIHVQGLLKKFWIDGHQFELRMDAPAEVVSIDGRKHALRLDTRLGQVFLNGIGLCRINFEKAQKVVIDDVERTLEFNPPAGSILIDGNLCSLNLSKKYPTVTIGNEDHGVRFDGPPREVTINGLVYVVPTDRPEIIKISNQGKPYSVALGGPGHEIIIDEKWYEVKFGGPVVQLKVGYKKLDVQIEGRSPEVKILGVIKTPDEITAINFQESEHAAFLDKQKADAFRRGEDVIVGDNEKPHRREKERFYQENPIEPENIAPEEMITGEGIGARFVSPIAPQMVGPRGPPYRMRGPPPPPPPPPGLRIHGPHRLRGPLPPPPPFLPRMGQFRGARARLPPPVPSLLQMPLPPRPPHEPMAEILQPAAIENPAPSTLDAEPNVNVNDLFAKLITAGIIRRKSTEKQAPVLPPPPANVATEAVATEVMTSPASLPASGNVQQGVGQILQQLQAGAASQPITSQHAPQSCSVKLKEIKDKKPKSQAAEEQTEEEIKPEPAPDMTNLQIDKMKVKYPSVVDRLYMGLQCNSCGTRFKDGKTDKYKEHLDWHFRQNKREKEDSRVVRNRRWYYSISDWVQFEEVGDLEERIVSNYFENMLASIHQVISTADSGVVPAVENAENCPKASASDEDNVCVICGDPFEQFYDDEEEEWHLRDAVRVDDKTYHPVCYEDAKNDLQSNSLLETPQPIKTESKIEQSSEDLPNPISNPLAYLTALSQKAKETSQPMDALAKFTVKTEPMEDAPVSSASAGLRSVASEPSISTKFNLGVASPKAVVKQEIKAMVKQEIKAVVKQEIAISAQEMETGGDEKEQKGGPQKTAGLGAMSEEDKIVLGFKSSDSKDANKTTIVPTSVKTEGNTTEGEAVATGAKNDPRLTARGGSNSELGKDSVPAQQALVTITAPKTVTAAELAVETVTKDQAESKGDQSKETFMDTNEAIAVVQTTRS